MVVVRLLPVVLAVRPIVVEELLLTRIVLSHGMLVFDRANSLVTAGSVVAGDTPDATSDPAGDELSVIPLDTQQIAETWSMVHGSMDRGPSGPWKVEGR